MRKLNKEEIREIDNKNKEKINLKTFFDVTDELTNIIKFKNELINELKNKNKNNDSDLKLLLIKDLFTNTLVENTELNNRIIKILKGEE